MGPITLPQAKHSVLRPMGLVRRKIFTLTKKISLTGPMGLNTVPQAYHSVLGPMGLVREFKMFEGKKNQMKIILGPIFLFSVLSIH